MATPWRVPKMWENKTVAVLATGPSLTREQCSLVAAAGLPAIAINDNGIDAERGGHLVPAMAPWADMLYATDAQWWRTHAQQALKFSGLKVTTMPSVEFRSVLRLRTTGSEGFDPDPECIRTGGNSGYAAVHVAIHTGAKRVLLLGFDMHDRNGLHWFGKHANGLRNTDPQTFTRWTRRFGALKGRGAEIINCTPGSALKCFPMLDLAEVLV